MGKIRFDNVQIEKLWNLLCGFYETRIMSKNDFFDALTCLERLTEIIHQTEAQNDKHSN